MTVIEHVLTDPDVDLVELTRRVGVKTGQELCFVARRPQDGVNGVLIFELADAAVRVPVEPRMVVSTIDEMAAERAVTKRRATARHTQELAEELTEPDLPHHAAEQLELFDAATSDAKRWAAVRAVLAHAADGEARFNETAMAAWRGRVEHLRTCPHCMPAELRAGLRGS